MRHQQIMSPLWGKTVDISGVSLNSSSPLLSNPLFSSYWPFHCFTSSTIIPVLIHVTLLPLLLDPDCSSHFSLCPLGLFALNGPSDHDLSLPLPSSMSSVFSLDLNKPPPLPCVASVCGVLSSNSACAWLVSLTVPHMFCRRSVLLQVTHPHGNTQESLTCSQLSQHLCPWLGKGAMQLSTEAAVSL